MTNSYRQPWNIEQHKNKKYFKRLASKVVRKLLEDPEILDISYKKYYNSWKICDYRSYQPNIIKYYRK